MIDEMIRTFEYTLDFVTKSVADLSEEEMIRQPSAIPNHATPLIMQVNLQSGGGPLANRRFQCSSESPK